MTFVTRFIMRKLLLASISLVLLSGCVSSNYVPVDPKPASDFFIEHALYQGELELEKFIKENPRVSPYDVCKEANKQGFKLNCRPYPTLFLSSKNDIFYSYMALRTSLRRNGDFKREEIAKQQTTDIDSKLIASLNSIKSKVSAHEKYAEKLGHELTGVSLAKDRVLYQAIIESSAGIPESKIKAKYEQPFRNIDAKIKTVNKRIATNNKQLMVYCDKFNKLALPNTNRISDEKLKETIFYIDGVCNDVTRRN